MSNKDEQIMPKLENKAFAYNSSQLKTKRIRHYVRIAGFIHLHFIGCGEIGTTESSTKTHDDYHMPLGLRPLKLRF